LRDRLLRRREAGCLAFGIEGRAAFDEHERRADQAGLAILVGQRHELGPDRLRGFLAARRDRIDLHQHLLDRLLQVVAQHTG
jgi:hypothetical protein